MRQMKWYEHNKEFLDEGNTHQLAGSFDTYAEFFTKVREDGRHATADELHNDGGYGRCGIRYADRNLVGHRRAGARRVHESEFRRETRVCRKP